MAKIEFDTRQIVKALSNISKKLENMTPVYRDIADLEWGQTRARYVKEIDPEGRRWPDPFTVRRDAGGVRSQAYRDPWPYVVASNYQAAPPGWHFFSPGRDKILRDTGTMFNSIGRAYSKDFAVVGTDLDYAEKHQNGDGVKVREFLGINQKTVENVDKVVKNYIKGLDK